MIVKEFLKQKQILQDMFITAIELTPELMTEIEITAFHDMLETRNLFNADWFDLEDHETGDTVSVSAGVFWRNLKDYEFTEDYDAVDAFNFVQIGILGDIVYG